MATELSDRWILQLRDEMVTRVSARATGCDIELTGRITVSGDASVRFRDATQVGLAKAVALPAKDMRRLIGAEVASAVGFKTGVLRLVFRPGYHLQISPEGAAGIEVRQAGVFSWTGSQGLGELTSLTEEISSS